MNIAGWLPQKYCEVVSAKTRRSHAFREGIAKITLCNDRCETINVRENLTSLTITSSAMIDGNSASGAFGFRDFFLLFFFSSRICAAQVRRNLSYHERVL